MFAIVDIAGFQEKVSIGDKLHVPLLEAEAGKKLTFSNVFLVSKDGGEVVIGAPTVEGASVEVTILSHGRDAKIRVFKMRRRKRYMRLKGHKQHFTDIEVTGIKA